MGLILHLLLLQGPIKDTIMNQRLPPQVRIYIQCTFISRNKVYFLLAISEIKKIHLKNPKAEQSSMTLDTFFSALASL